MDNLSIYEIVILFVGVFTLIALAYTLYKEYASSDRYYSRCSLVITVFISLEIIVTALLNSIIIGSIICFGSVIILLSTIFYYIKREIRNLKRKKIKLYHSYMLYIGGFFSIFLYGISLYLIFT